MIRLLSIILALLMLFSLESFCQKTNREIVNQIMADLEKSISDTNKIKNLIELGKFHIYKAGEDKKDLDSGYYFLEKALLLSDSLNEKYWKHESQSLIVIYYMEGRNVEQGRALFDILIADCRQTGDKKTEAISNFRFATSLRILHDREVEVLERYELAASILNEIGDKENEIMVLKEIAYFNSNQGNFDLAEAQLLKILEMYKSINFKNLHYTYNLIANVNRMKGDLNQALYYSILCLESMEQTKDTVSACYFYGDIARIYFDLGNKIKSIEYYKKSLEKWKQEHHPNFALYFAASYIIKDLIEKKRPIEGLELINNLSREIKPITLIQYACIAQCFAYCYDALNKEDQAEKYYLEALGWYEKANMDFEVSQKAEYEIAKFYLKHQAYTKAEKHLQNVLSFNPQKNSLSTLRDVEMMFFQVDSAAHNYESAIDHLRQHKILNDSIFKESRIRQIEELEIKYETEKKEQELKLQERNVQLLTEKGKLQNVQLAQARFNRNVTLGIILLLLVILALLFYQFWSKQKNNKQLEEQQSLISTKNKILESLLSEKDKLLVEKEWLLKEIHHRVKNNLQIVMSLLNSQSAYLQNEVALSALHESQNRMRSMSLIHQKLYQSENVTLINMAEYIRELVEYLKDSFKSTRKIQFQFELDPIETDVSQAVPLGLILNEGITNAIKYAFPEVNEGIIHISLLHLTDSSFRLVIADNGIGLPENFDLDKSQSLGMSLIKGLSKQLGGKINFRSMNGLTISIVIKNIKPIYDNTKALELG